LPVTPLSTGSNGIPASPSIAKSQTQKIDGRPTLAVVTDDVLPASRETRLDPSASVKLQVKGKSQDEANRSSSGRTEATGNEAASAALARVLHAHDLSSTDEPPRRAVKISSTTEGQMHDSDTSDGSVDVEQDTRPGAHVRGARDTAQLPADTHPSLQSGPLKSQINAARSSKRDESTTVSQADDGDADSIYSSRTNTTRSATAPSANINGGLQRRRTGLKHTGHNPGDQHRGLSSHLKRRVLSKEFCKLHRDVMLIHISPLELTV
jgi:hypothetical protein